MKDKLAEEILKEKGFFVMTHKEGSEHVRKAFIEPVIKAMQAYHEAANKAVTDEDIDVHIIEHYELKSVPFCLGFTKGAKAFRDGLIKHIDP